MDTLLAPGGCPWDREQDHASLVQYVLEEAYEVAEAIETEDRAALREELGDVLLQVVFHSALARGEDQPFDLDDVAGDVADKLVRRHPSVFPPPGGESDDAGRSGADRDAPTAEASYLKWDQIKAAEKSRTSVLDGIPLAQPALARTEKVIGRARRGGLDADALAAEALRGTEPDAIGPRLFRLVFEAEAAGVEAEAALRASLRAFEQAIRRAESGSGV
jgi:XTP/dITP diphosphohydrolase